MHKGIYCLVFRNRSCTVDIGALGEVTFPGGWHVYTGSAQGPGGLARVARHIRVKREGIRSPHWHVDYLLVHPEFRLRAVACAPATSQSNECRIAGLLARDPVPGFGCSDCRCRSHLAYFKSNPENEIKSAFSHTGLDVTITRLNIS